MKYIIILLIAALGVFACNNNDKAKKETISLEKKATSDVKKSVGNSTYLCKINGKKWAYTKASGIVTRNKNTGKRTAIITFKNKLKKGSESIQLTYDGDSYILESASLQLKFPKKGGGDVLGFYKLFPDTRNRNPDSDMSGNIDLSNPNTASGNAELINFNISYEKDLLNNIDNAVISVTDLKFDKVNYSDVNKLFKKQEQ